VRRLRGSALTISARSLEQGPWSNVTSDLVDNEDNYSSYGCSSRNCMAPSNLGGGVMRSCIRNVLIALFFCTTLAGCADILWWPGFNPITTAYVDTIPVRRVATEIQCEIFRFIDTENADKNNVPLLDPAKGATVSLILQTDLTGSVQYVGINLSKLGFTSAAQLVTATNNVPTLQAKGTIHDTISAEVDFVVAQTRKGPQKVASKAPASALVKKTDIGGLYENASFKQISSDPAVFQAQESMSTNSPPSYFPVADCSHQNPLAHAYLELWLQDWLLKYKNSEETDQKSLQFVCNTKVTLHSQFQIAADVSAGVNGVLNAPIILPISGLNVDASPSWQHSLQISFAIKDPDPKHAAYCGGLEGTQPAQVNR
jgi:hypothetical protein